MIAREGLMLLSGLITTPTLRLCYELYYVKDVIGGEIDPEEKFVIHAGEVNT